MPQGGARQPGLSEPEHEASKTRFGW